MNKNKLREELTILFWIFIIGSIAGFIFEITVVFFQKGHFELRQGLIYGPFIPVYGIGAILYYVVLNKIKLKNKLYLCSFMQEKLFGTISWDYSYLPFNIQGRTSLLHCIYWGIGGILYITYIEPLIEKMREKMNKNSIKIITIILAIFIIFDITISWMAERKSNVEPENKMDLFFDEYYPDEYIDRIFNNKKYVF